MSIDINNYLEKELHPFLVYYLQKGFGIGSKTIDQSKSKNTTKGENEWIHPDIVGYSLPLQKWEEDRDDDERFVSNDWYPY